MEYIDKAKNRSCAHDIIKKFLDNCLKDAGEYPQDLYGAFLRDSDSSHSLKRLIVEDSNQRCCYCMRSLRGVSLEHVIPQSIKTRIEYDKYFEIESNLDKNNIMLTTDFLAKPEAVPPFPHVLAYENLIPSCLGSLPKPGKCCNIYRHDVFVQPIVFRENIHEEIIYKSTGTVIWQSNSDEDVPTVERLGLNCAELKAIRRIWYYLDVNHLGCEEENKNRAITDISYELMKTGDRRMFEMVSNFRKHEYWALLADYPYFSNLDVFENC